MGLVKIHKFIAKARPYNMFKSDSVKSHSINLNHMINSGRIRVEKLVTIHANRSEKKNGTVK